MPKGYEKMRDAFAKEMGMKAAKTKAAKIWNSKHKSNPVTGRSEEKEFVSRLKNSKKR